jgi:hypothetical protein
MGDLAAISKPREYEPIDQSAEKSGRDGDRTEEEDAPTSLRKSAGPAGCWR